MDLKEAMERRHSVRQYTDRPIPPDVRERLQDEIARRNQESGLHIQLALEEPEAFQGILAHYGKFRNVRNYLCFVGPKGQDLEETVGYHGEALVLESTRLGLDSCWVALTCRKGKCRCAIGPGEKLACVAALGYGAVSGVPHKSRPLAEVCRGPEPFPDWFLAGAEAALLAPTAVNQQKFLLTLEGEKVRAEATGGFYSKIDLGIVKYHFEIGSGRTDCWA